MSLTIKQIQELSFEDAMSRLDAIVGAMETDRMPLEEMIRSYEEGITLLKNCRQRLESARRRVEMISADLESGKAAATPLDDAAVDDSEDNASPRQPSSKRRKASENDEIRLF
jgi:exodeoxyribonuclease VII small subunit